MSDVRALRYRQFRLWLVDSLYDWAEYCRIDEAIIGNSAMIKLAYDHTWDILREWAEQDLNSYIDIHKINSPA